MAILGVLLSTPPPTGVGWAQGVPHAVAHFVTAAARVAESTARWTRSAVLNGLAAPAEARASLTGNSTFDGRVYGIAYDGGPPTPIPGAVVQVLAINRTTVLATTTAGVTGNYSVTVGELGSFYVASRPTGAWGGGWPTGTSALWPTVFPASGTAALDLYAYPRIPYNNKTIVLPAWNNLSLYLDNGNGNSGTTFVQQPVLSWVQDGVYYINATNDLVFYSIPNATATLVHAWVPLYTNMMNYAGWQNEFFLTPDGQFAYGAGCLAKCAGASEITFFAVNLTTDRSFEHNFTGVTGTTSNTNAQVNMVGLDGNASVAVYTTEDGIPHLWNLWNDTQWEAGKFTYFEANNLYWVPYLDSFVNFQAEGAKGDHLEQWRYLPNGTFGLVWASQWYPGGFVANGVNGLFLNVTSHLLWAGIDYQGGIQSFAYNWTSNGTLNSEVYFYQSASNISKFPKPRILPQVSSDEHRYTVVASGPAFQTAWWPYGGNDSFLVDPTPDHIAFYSSNVSVDHLDNSSYYPDQAYAHSYALDGQYFDTSRLISYYSYDCLANFAPKATTCPVAGSSPGTVPGTIYYIWRTGLNVSPNPVTNGQAQAAPPTNPTVQTMLGVDWLNVSWNDSDAPLLNFTVYWGTSAAALTHSASLGPQNRSFNITGLRPSTTYDVRIVALNLHSLDNGTLVNATLPADTNVPTDLRVIGVNSTYVTLAWTNPPSSLLNDTVYVGRTCGTWTQEDSAGVVNTYRVHGLAPETGYCFEVGAWNRSGEGPHSDDVYATTAGVPRAPTSLQVTAVSASSLSVAWVNPPGPLVNITLFYGLNCGDWTTRLSLGVVAQRIVTSLLPDTTYCFAVVAWNQSGPGAPSLPTQGTPFPSVPDAASDLGVSDVTNTTVELAWVLPSGLRDTSLLNVSVYQGNACGNWSSQTGVGAVADNYQVTSLLSLTTYYWAVALWNSAGESVLSACASATTLPPHITPPPSPAFSYLTLTDIEATNVTVSWTFQGGVGAAAVSNVEYFIVLAGTTCGSPEQSVLASKSPALVTGLSPSTSYCFAVSAIYPNFPTVTSGGLTASTTELHLVTRPPVPPPPKPSNFPTLYLEIGAVAAALVAIEVAAVLLERRRRPPDASRVVPSARGRAPESPARR